MFSSSTTAADRLQSLLLYSTACDIALQLRIIGHALLFRLPGLQYSACEVMAMKRMLIKQPLVTACVLIILLAAGAMGQCGCEQATSTGPGCYTSFAMGDQISFKLVVPADYFFSCPACTTPLITGWRVETESGNVVTRNDFCNGPIGHWLQMTWDQEGECLTQVMPGYYRVVIETTTAGEITTFVKIVSSPCCCGMAPRLCSIPCVPAPAMPYIEIVHPAGWSPCCRP